MREVLSLVASGGDKCAVVGDGTSNGTNNVNNGMNNNGDQDNNNNVEPDECAPGPVKMLTSQPGYLELSPERMEQLVSQLPIEDFYEVEDQPFARGKYATVRRCRCRTTGQQFAAKVVRKRRRSADLRAEVLHEVAVLDACRGCPRIVRLHRVFESATDMVLLLELAAGGELQMVLDRDEVFEEREVARLMKQILHGLIFLHDINVAHLDLKPQNLVLTGEFPDCDVKLCDFGISRYLSQGADVREILGTPDYVAPEVLNYEPISLATDMWSVGVLLYVLLTGCSPFGGETKQETFCNISQCRLDFPEDLFEDVSDVAKDLMRNLIVKDPKRRLSATQCLEHEWFTSQESVPATLCQAGPAHAASSPTSTPFPAPLLPATPCPPPTTSSPSPLRRHSIAVLDALDDVPPPLPATPPPSRATPPHAPTPLSHPIDSRDLCDLTARSGISAIRRNKFMRNMESIVQRLSVVEGAGGVTRWEAPVKKEVAADAPAATSTPTAPSEAAPSEPAPSSRSVSRATAMQTMPIRSLDGYKFDRGFDVPASTPLRTTASSSSVMDLRSDGSAKDTVFKFRKVYILEDAEDLQDPMTHMPSPPPSINGSTGSSGSSVYSDNSISDSNSDTVSELSVDSSSDRSSIISLDDSWDMAYARLNGRPYPGVSYATYNVWNSTATSSRQRGARLYPRECNGSFARAISRFATEPESKTLPKTQTHTQTKPILSKLALMQTAINNGKRCGLELMREQNSNLVVIREIREVKPGGRYARFSEVKCESVQSRIRKLQVRGARS